MRTPIAVAVLIVTALAAASAAQTTRGTTLTPAEAEHLLNRAGFGGTPQEIAALTQLDRRAAALLLVDGPEGWDPEIELAPFDADLTERPARSEFMGKSEDERRKVRRDYRRKDRRQYEQLRAWWCDRMLATRHPLVEKMVLFWHNHFTSSFRDVRNSYHMALQNELFRDEALGNFGDLLHAVSRDPAMLEYLDNRSNRKRKPNENFAREVMELFTVGVGNYTEKDIKEAARAFTGWTFRGNEFVLARRQHDFGKKTFLGKTGRFNGDDILDILLEQPATARLIATKLIRYFVGPNAPKAMAARYATLLRASKYEIRPVLLKLFQDPDFYREEVRCSRIMGPIELLVSNARRLGVKPPGALIANTGALLGQTLLAPPNVKGWDGGIAWISTSTFLMRGNLASYLVTGVTPQRIRRDFGGGDGGMSREMMQMQRRSLPRLQGRTRWNPDVRIKDLVAGKTTPEAIVDTLADRLLAVPITEEARKSVTAYCHTVGTRVSDDFRVPTEYQLKRIARILLSLPEAQLN